ncbi:MAG: hypothetical protein ACREL5_01950 [Gemmatimonadales bacterium]
MRIPGVLAAALMLAPAAAAAQDIPPYVPANPLLESRSALYAQPFISPHAGWQVRFLSDYYNAVEVAQSPPPVRQTVFDAEVLQADVWVTRDITPRIFVIGNVPIRGGYNGFLDPALNWYHKVIGLSVPARDELPIDKFQWNFALPDTAVTRARPGTFIGDVRAGAGLRAGRIELIASVTLPTATVHDDGWTRHVVGTSLDASADLLRNSRLVLNAAATVGFTPVSGALAKYQRATFAAGLVAARWRFAGQQAVFATIWLQSPNWKGTGFTAFGDPEFATDFGFLLRLKGDWPELQLGMTQDLDPHGPAMDVGLTIGVVW